MKLFRNELPQEGIAFVVMPSGERTLPDGTSFDFDALYRTVTAPTLTDCGMVPERVDRPFGTNGTLEALWSGIQHAEVVLIDCSFQPAESAMALGLALALGKRLVILAQRGDDVPADLRDKSQVILYDTAGMGIATLIQSLRGRIRQSRSEPVTENSFTPLAGTATWRTEGVVVLVAKDQVMVETVEEGTTRLRALGNRDVDYGRIVSNMSRLFRVGDRLDGAVTTGPDGAERYTLLADKVNPWRRIASTYVPGHVFTGRVVNLREGIGAFIAVTDEINGFLPYAEARQGRLTRDAEVTVEVVEVNVETRKIALRLRQALESADVASLPRTGERLVGQIIQAVPERRNRSGGFLLVRLAGYENGPLAMLHCTRMAAPLRAELNSDAGGAVNKLIWVEVIHIDRARHRIQLTHLMHCVTSPAAPALP
jgi:small subunit ribosomal protein S1